MKPHNASPQEMQTPDFLNLLIGVKSLPRHQGWEGVIPPHWSTGERALPYRILLNLPKLIPLLKPQSPTSYSFKLGCPPSLFTKGITASFLSFEKVEITKKSVIFFISWRTYLSNETGSMIPHEKYSKIQISTVIFLQPIKSNGPEVEEESLTNRFTPT